MGSGSQRLIFLVLALAPLACQVSSQLTPTPDFNEDQSRVYFHQIVKDRNRKAPAKVVIDNKPVEDIEGLDQRGLVQPQGHHSIEIQGPINPKSLGYQLHQKENLHLYQCESDGQVHMISIPNNRQASFDVAAEGEKLCAEGGAKP